jgi:hypothetical protein
MNNEIQSQTATAKFAECDVLLAVLAAEIEVAEAKLAALPMRDPGRRAMRKRIAELAADRADAASERARLEPLMAAERAEAEYQVKLANHRAALEQGLPHLNAAARDIDLRLSALIRAASALIPFAEMIGEAAGIPYDPNRLLQPIPTKHQIGAIIQGRLVVEGFLPMDQMPDFAASELLPGQAAAAASVSRDIAGPLSSFVAANPPKSPATLAAEREAADARRARAEAMAARPIKMQPASPPTVFYAAPPAPPVVLP